VTDGAAYRVTELLGDGIGAELSEALHTLAGALPQRIEFVPVDLSLEGRRRAGRAIYNEAVASIRATHFAVKHPTVTADESPNAVLRNLCNFSVIHRPVVSIPGVKSNFTAHVDLDVVRVATGGTYEDPGRMIGSDAAVSLRIVERRPSRDAAIFAFELARKLGKSVTSSSKYTIQKVTDGLFEGIVNEVSQSYKDVPHQKELFDALLAKIVMKPERFQVVLVLNEYGDFLSDMACGLVGSIGIGASASYAFDEKHDVLLGLFDPVGGSAPDIAGKGIANPTATFLSFSLLLAQLDLVDAARAVRESTLSLLASGELTPDLGGKLTTREFTSRVASAVRERLAARPR
jgi:isocitrate dehydrogenase (NAD+)